MYLPRLGTYKNQPSSTASVLLWASLGQPDQTLPSTSYTVLRTSKPTPRTYRILPPSLSISPSPVFIGSTRPLSLRLNSSSQPPNLTHQITPTSAHTHARTHAHTHIHTMCDYTQREYQCGHYRWIAALWCRDYTRTHRRCQPNVTHFEYRADELCSQCRPKQHIPWENMIKRPTKAPTFSL